MNLLNELSAESLSKRVGTFLTIFLMTSGMLAAALGGHYLAEKAALRTALEAGERASLSTAAAGVNHGLEHAVSDLTALAEQGRQHALFDNLETSSGLETSNRVLAKALLSLGGPRLANARISLVDLEGREIVTLTGDDHGPAVLTPDRPRAAVAPRLSSGVERLERGEVDISLWAEGANLKLAGPSRYRAIHLATPVFGSTGSKKGTISLHYDPGALSKLLASAAVGQVGRILILDPRGSLLIHPGSPRAGGNAATEGGNSFQGSFPGAWRRLRATGAGQFLGEKGLFTFAAMSPSRSAQGGAGAAARETAGTPLEDPWTIVSHLPPEALDAAPRFAGYWPLYAFMFVLLTAMSAMLTFAMIKCDVVEARVEFERRFKAALENTELLTLGLDTTGHVTFCNQALADVVGSTRGEALDFDWFEEFIPEDKRAEQKRSFHGMNSGDLEPYSFEGEVLTRRAERRLISWNVCIMSNTLGQVIGATCIGQDITLARRAEEQLRKLSAAVEQSPSVVMITDTAGVIEYVNPKFTELTGYTLDEMLGKNPRVLKTGETSSVEYERLWQTVSAGQEWRGVFHNRKKNGELYWESASISPIRDGNGKISHFVAVKEDITERVRLQDEVEDRNREIARNEALAVTGRMAMMVAHDLRNPLSSIKMALQIFGKKFVRESSGEEQELKEIAIGQVHYMERILKDLLSYSRPDALSSEPLKIDEVLDAAVLHAQGDVDAQGARVTTCYEAGSLPILQGDGGKLEQAFSNLIGNALQANEGMEAGGAEVTISANLVRDANGASIVVEIVDRGCGFDPDQEEQLFEPFFTTRAKGTGLGLSIVRQVIEGHDGTVRLLPRANGGTRAVAVLPVRPVENDAAARAETGPKVDGTSFPNPRDMPAGHNRPAAKQ